MPRLRLFISILFLFIAGFSGHAVADGDTDTNAYYTVHQQRQLAQPTANRALVYIIRPQFLGMAVKFWAFMDDNFLAVTCGKKYTYALVKPGSHVFWAKAENVNAIRINVEAGRTYYLQQKVKMGAFRGGVQLRVIDEATALKMIKKCKFITPSNRAIETSKGFIGRFYPQARQAAVNYPEKTVGNNYKIPDKD